LRGTVVRALVGLLLGLGTWWALREPYNRMLVGISAPLLRIFEPETRLIASGDEITIDRSDFGRGSPRPALATSQLTINFILLTALFAANRKPLSNRNVAGFSIASIVLIACHVVAIILNVESIFALRLGPWSAAHYGPFARNFWSASAHFDTLVGSFGEAIILWWILGRSSTADSR
jgi:hypothetical protein